jgi:sugar phosphate isomerase/epimerase
MDVSLTISTPGSRFSPIVLQGDYIEQIRIAKDLGFNYVELHVRDPKKIDLSLLKKGLLETGIKVSTIGTGQAYVDEQIYFSSPDESIRRKAIERIKNQIRFAAELKAKVIIGTIKGPLPLEVEKVQTAKDYILKALIECVKFAKQFGTQLTLEAINRYESNYLNNAAETVELIQEVDSPFLGLHLDTFHMNIEEISITKTLCKYSDYLAHLHLADSNRWAPGMGHMNFRSILKTLQEINYQGFLGIECLPVPSPREAAVYSLKYITNMLKRM